VRRRPAAVTIVTAVVFAFLYAPILIVIVNSTNVDPLLLAWRGFTLHWYGVLLADSRVQTDFLASLEIGVISTVISLSIAVAAGLWSRGAPAAAKRILDATSYMRIVLPEVVIALALFVLLRLLGVDLGLWTIVVGHVVFNSAYATVIIQARLATLSVTLEEAAADLGAKPRRVFQRVTVPLLMPGILVAMLLTLTFSFDDVVSSLFLGGTNTETLPVLMLGMVRLHVTPEVNAMGVGVMLFTMASFSVAALTVRSTAGVRAITSATASLKQVEGRA
jgi:ABC-type spermidine/putrescine transport system permease subunit II